MACCGQGNKPGHGPLAPIVLGDADPDAPVVYARVTVDGQDLVRGVSSGDQRYFTGTGLGPALEQGMLVDVSADSMKSRKAARHEFAVVIPGEPTERFGIWKAAKERAREAGGRIEVVPAEKQEV